MSLKSQIYTMSTFFFILASFQFLYAGETSQSDETIDFQKFNGSWSELARIENKHEESCGSAQIQIVLPRTQKESENFIFDKAKLIIDTQCNSNNKIKDFHINAQIKNLNAKTNRVLEFDFMPGWLSWTGIGKDIYQILFTNDSYDLAIISNDNKSMLWVLGRGLKLNSESIHELEPIFIQNSITSSSLKKFSTDEIVIRKISKDTLAQR